MSAAAINAKGFAAPSIPAPNPWLIAIVVALASFMEVLDTTIANVALPYIAGGMGVSEDEASWVVTSYLVSNAIILTASSFLARMLGRKRFFLICLGIFTVSSILCGFASNLNELLLFRILQGLGGGGMVPVAQSILADAFPPAKRGRAFALFGIAVVVAPVKRMVPFSAASMSGSTHLVAQKAPKRLIFVKPSNSSVVVLRISRPLTRRAPAL